ncbi:Purine-cytosine permease fcyB [Leucoagaricus sp. SymC.cos]|nr:Purine-cytosine permease fcyB [Leucoagaricus sp. SymC.cos]
MPAFVSTWGPKLGMRQMVISRYAFGYYGVILCCVLNLIGMCGFSILNCILGGQALASVLNGNLNWTVGIVVIGVVSLLVSFCGGSVLTWYERVAWFPVIITFAIALGLGGKHLGDVTFEPATARGVLSFASTLAGFTVTYTPLGSDYTTYFREDVKSWKIFLYSYFGFILSIIPLQCTGAAVIASASSVPLWEQSHTNGDVGGLLEAMLEPVHGFGKFLTVLLSLSVIGNVAIVPRYFFSALGTAIVIALAVVGQHRFYETLVNFLGLLGYWSAAYVMVIFLEHLYFRKGRFDLYDTTAWNTPSLLPTGIAAVAAVIFAFGPVVPCVDQIWYVGPVAETTGDIGFEVAFVASAIFYFVFRWIEVRWRGGL